MGKSKPWPRFRRHLPLDSAGGLWISDASPASIHLTVPSDARLRRKTPKCLVVHHVDLSAGDITLHEGIPVTTVERTITDLLRSGGRTDLLKQAVSDARREGYITEPDAARLRRRIKAI